MHVWRKLDAGRIIIAAAMDAFKEGEINEGRIRC